jgi:hypothetical protein
LWTGQTTTIGEPRSSKVVRIQQIGTEPPPPMPSNDQSQVAQQQQQIQPDKADDTE